MRSWGQWTEEEWALWNQHQAYYSWSQAPGSAAAGQPPPQANSSASATTTPQPDLQPRDLWSANSDTWQQQDSEGQGDKIRSKYLNTQVKRIAMP